MEGERAARAPAWTQAISRSLLAQLVGEGGADLACDSKMRLPARGKRGGHLNVGSPTRVGLEFKISFLSCRITFEMIFGNSVVPVEQQADKIQDLQQCKDIWYGRNH